MTNGWALTTGREGVEKVMENPKTTLAMHTLLLLRPSVSGDKPRRSEPVSRDAEGRGQLRRSPRLIEEHEFDLIVVDLLEVLNLGEFPCSRRLPWELIF